MILTDDAATRAAGARLAGALVGGDAIALVGDLGAGKTTFVAGLVAAFGAVATSPTFALLNEYPGRLIVWHVDLYRIDKAAELPELGLDDLAGDPRGVLIVEWADKFDVLPRDHLRIELAYDPQLTRDPRGRVLTATGTGPRGAALAAALDPPR